MKAILALTLVLMTAPAVTAWADVARPRPIESGNLDMTADGLMRRSGRLSSRRAQWELARGEGLVALLPVTRPSVPPRPKADSDAEKEIAALAIVARLFCADKRGDHPDGLLVTAVKEGGAGERCGLITGDVIVGVDDGIARTMEEMAGVLGSLEPGKEMSLTVRRDDTEERDVILVRVLG